MWQYMKHVVLFSPLLGDYRNGAAAAAAAASAAAAATYIRCTGLPSQSQWQCNGIQYIQCNAIQCNAIQYNALQYNTI